MDRFDVFKKFLVRYYREFEEILVEQKYSLAEKEVRDSFQNQIESLFLDILKRAKGITFVHLLLWDEIEQTLFPLKAKCLVKGDAKLFSKINKIANKEETYSKYFDLFTSTIFETEMADRPILVTSFTDQDPPRYLDTDKKMQLNLRVKGFQKAEVIKWVNNMRKKIRKAKDFEPEILNCFKKNLPGIYKDIRKSINVSIGSLKNITETLYEKGDTRLADNFENPERRFHYYLWMKLFSPSTQYLYHFMPLFSRDPCSGIVIGSKIPISKPAFHFVMQYFYNFHLPLSISFAREKMRVASLRSAVAAIMARNISHNIGSHVLSSLTNMSAEDTAKFVNAILGQDNIPEREQLKKYVEGKLPDFLYYLQARLDFISNITTGVQNIFGKVKFGEVIENFNKQDLLLNGLSTSGKTKVVKTSLRDGHRYGDFKEQFIVLPFSEVVGLHDIYSIFENFIRNILVHNKPINKGSDELAIKVSIAKNEENKIEIALTPNFYCYKRDLDKMQSVFDKPILVGANGEIDTHDWGLKEIAICGALLRGKLFSSLEKIIRVRSQPLTKRKYKYSVQFYLLKHFLTYDVRNRVGGYIKKREDVPRSDFLLVSETDMEEAKNNWDLLPSRLVVSSDHFSSKELEGKSIIVGSNFGIDKDLRSDWGSYTKLYKRWVEKYFGTPLQIEGESDHPQDKEYFPGINRIYRSLKLHLQPIPAVKIVFKHGDRGSSHKDNHIFFSHSNNWYKYFDVSDMADTNMAKAKVLELIEVVNSKLLIIDDRVHRMWKKDLKYLQVLGIYIFDESAQFAFRKKKEFSIRVNKEEKALKDFHIIVGHLRYFRDYKKWLRKFAKNDEQIASLLPPFVFIVTGRGGLPERGGLPPWGRKVFPYSSLQNWLSPKGERPWFDMKVNLVKGVMAL